MFCTNLVSTRLVGIITVKILCLILFKDLREYDFSIVVLRMSIKFSFSVNQYDGLDRTLKNEVYYL